MKIQIVEKKNHLAVHGIFQSVESAENHLKNKIPDFCQRGFFMDKTLTPESFEIQISEVCSWCSGSKELTAKLKLAGYIVSHGICKSCSTNFLNKKI